jgi:hypothetical protein
MRHVRTSTLLATLAIAASTLAAPSASALLEPLAHNQTPRLLVSQEVHAAPDPLCPLVTPSPAPSPGPTVTSGGCRIHFSGTHIQFWTHELGMEGMIWDCNIEFDMRLDGSGEGYMTHQEFTDASVGSCTATACGQPSPIDEGRAWSVFMREAEPAPTERLTFVICIKSSGGGVGDQHCEYTLDFSQPTPHRYRFTGGNTRAHSGGDPFCEEIGGPVELGIFETEAVSGVTGEGQAEQLPEIRHS